MTVLLPIWLQSGSYSAELDRRVISSFGVPAGGGSLSSRSGVLPGVGGELAVTALGTPNMSVNVASGTALVSGTFSGTQGTYLVTNDGTVNISIGAANASQPRIDIIVFEVLDSSYSGSSNLAQLRVVAGTPASSPVPAVTPASSIVLAQVRVNANATSITTGNITAVRPWSGARGEALRCTSTTRPTSPYVGMEVYETDQNRGLLWTGTYWMKTSGDAHRQMYEHVAPGLVIQNGAAMTTYKTSTWTPSDGVYASARIYTSTQFTAPGNAAGWFYMYLNNVEVAKVRFNSRNSGGYFFIKLDSEQQKGAPLPTGVPGLQTLKLNLAVDSVSSDITIYDTFVQVFY